MVTKPHILVIDSEAAVRSLLCNLLEKQDYHLSQATSISEAKDNFNITSFDLIISELNLSQLLGTELLNIAPQVPLVIMSESTDLRCAIDIMRQGATDYIAKPLNIEQLLEITQRILHNLKYNNDKNRHRTGAVVGDSAQIIKIAHKIQKAARSLAPILILGEFGSGRRKVARNIHDASNFSKQPFVIIDCALVDEKTLRNKLRTDINKTFFFNNICELSLSLQTIVSSAFKQKNIRIIASTEQDLSTATAVGEFRNDLLFNLSVITINVPPVRERKTDLPALIEYFIDRYSVKLGYKASFTSEAMQAMNDYHWPGNVKQLKDTIYQALALSDHGESIDATSLYLPITKTNKPLSDSDRQRPYQLSLEDYFIHFVSQNQQHMSETTIAERLGISRKSLWERRIKLGLPRIKK